MPWGKKKQCIILQFTPPGFYYYQSETLIVSLSIEGVFINPKIEKKITKYSSGNSISKPWNSTHQ